MTGQNTTFLVLLLSIFLSVSTLSAKGKMTGGSMHEAPDWFKESFLDMGEDIEEALEANKHVMLFMDLDGCPYCTKMLKESFIKENSTSEYIKENFDVININVKGSREIAWNEDESFTEKELAEKLNIQYSPTILFLDADKNVVVRINGYRSPENFKYILEYVSGKHYTKMKLGEFVNKVNDKSLYTLKSNKLFQNKKNLSGISTPLAVIFEDGSCVQCEYFHNTLLKDNGVLDEFSKYTVVRLDANSNEKIIDVNGKETTAKKWVESINLDYRPGILLYNEKKVINTVDALLYTFHFKELLRYVSGKHYVKYDGYLPYLRVRQVELLNSGINIDISK
jgi:thioredoxin-related protein